MAIRLVSAALDYPYPDAFAAHDRLILIALADQANEGGWTWVGYRRLTGRIGASQSTLQRRLKALQRDGYLQVHVRPGRSNAYRLTLPTIALDDDPTLIPEGCTPAHPQLVDQGPESGHPDDQGGGSHPDQGGSHPSDQTPRSPIVTTEPSENHLEPLPAPHAHDPVDELAEARARLKGGTDGDSSDAS